ncbi:MAG: anaerobic ribonucleoside-triphosphate reductase [Leptospirales bacterium]|nr:anaerobic ribonucleoside-triphosphate reductase [Leptospirales bacterium]
MNNGLKVQTEIYSRVAGYFRPVNQWNKGKQEEFAARKEYILDSNCTDKVVLLDEYKRAV